MGVAQRVFEKRGFVFMPVSDEQMDSFKQRLASLLLLLHALAESVCEWLMVDGL